MPGLRLGVLASVDVDLVRYIKQDVSIWNINSFAEFYLQIFNKYDLYYRFACENFVAERNRFYMALSSIPYLRVIPSHANYFLCKVTDYFTSSELTKILLNHFNILIKDCDTKTGLEGRNYIRIAIRNREDNDKLVEALKQCVK